MTYNPSDKPTAPTHRKVDPKKLVPADDNPQRMAPETFAALKAALAQDTDTIDEPAVWLDASGKLRIISGHHRVRAAIELGWPKISVKVFSDPKLDERWYRRRILSVNRTHGDPDRDALRAFIETSIDVKGLHAFLADTGYSDKEIERIRQDIAGDDAGAPLDVRVEYLLVVECVSEQQQQTLYNDFRARGLSCKIM